MVFDTQFFLAKYDDKLVRSNPEVYFHFRSVGRLVYIRNVRHSYYLICHNPNDKLKYDFPEYRLGADMKCILKRFDKFDFYQFTLDFHLAVSDLLLSNFVNKISNGLF